MPFLLNEVCSCASLTRQFRGNHPLCFLMSGWNGFICLRAHSFLNHSCICKCCRWRDNNKMQPAAVSGKEMTCITLRALHKVGHLGSSVSPEMRSYNTASCSPGKSFFFFFSFILFFSFFFFFFSFIFFPVAIYWTRNNRRPVCIHSPWPCDIFPSTLFIHDADSTCGERSKNCPPLIPVA